MMATAPAVGAPPRAPILGTGVSASSFDGAVAWLAAAVADRQAVYASPATVYSIMLGRDRPSYRQIVNRAAYVMADGMPLVWTLRRLGHEAERVHGDDLFLAFCTRHPKLRHFLVGGREGQSAIVAVELERRIPGISVVGHCPTPRRPVPAAETRSIVQEIHEAGAEVVWVGMGTPAQDEWMAEVRERVGCPLAGVGSVFDLLAGRSRPAPEWIKRAGLQWLFRLVQEPRRLWWRYLYYNPRFVLGVVLELLGWRRDDGWDGP